MLDLYYLPLHLENDQEMTSLPGLSVNQAPRFANRHRASEILAVLLTPNDPLILPPAELEKILDKITTTYFRTSGPVTASLRAVTDQLNDTFLKINQKSRPGSNPVSAALNLIVLRRDILFHLRSGPTTNLVIGRDHGTEQADAPQTAYSLGLTGTFNPPLKQCQLKPGDLLVLYVDPPPNVTAIIPQSGARLPLEHLRQIVAKQANGKGKAVFAQVKPGNGKLHLIQARISLTEGEKSQTAGGSLKAEKIPEKQDAIPPKQPESGQPKEPASTPTPPRAVRPKPAVRMAQIHETPVTWRDKVMGAILGEETIVQRRLEKTKRTVSPDLLRRSAAAAKAAKPDEQAALTVSPTEERPPQTAIFPGEAAPTTETNQQDAGTAVRPRQRNDSFRKRMAAAWQTGVNARRKVQHISGQFMEQVLPSPSNHPSPLTPAVMLFIAVAVPLILVSIAATVYFQEGPGKQQQLYVEQAQEQILQASILEDPVMQRSALIQGLALLDKAESYIVTDASRSLRLEAQQALDGADGVVRILFEPQSDVIDGAALITNIQTSPTETYLLNSSDGSILRLYSLESKFILDKNFNCRPGQMGLTTIGPLIDMVALPPGNPNKATVLGIDSKGNLLYCIPGNPPLANSLPLPDMGWGKIGGIFLDEGILYVMDSQNNAVYLYYGENNIYLSPPRAFFDNTIPTLVNVIDFEVKGEDLFLLHEDGLMTKCVFRTIDMVQTRCTDPMQYTDNRYGKTEKLLTLPAARFTHLVTTLPPEPSVYILDANIPSIYHFGLGLTLYEQIQMQVYTNFSKPQTQVSAFAISPGRRVWLAFGNRVFFAQLP